MRRRNAFTLTELLIAVLVLTIAAAYMTLSPEIAKLTAKAEANRIVTQLYRIIEAANRKNVSFKVLFNGKKQTESVPVQWQVYPYEYDELKLTKGFSIKNLNYSVNESHTMISVGSGEFHLVYNVSINGFNPPGMTLEVKAPDESVHYIIIYVPGGRIRTSNTKP